MPGRSVRIFLVDGTPQGIRTAEVGNWSGLAVVGPRTDLARLGARPAMARTGVYLLLGPSDTSASGLTIYVGEGDEVWARLRTHDSDIDKDWWTWVTIFVSKDDNLTKAHVRWLEARLIDEIRRAKRAELMNGTTPIGGRLPEADAADMETFFENVRLLLPTLGVNVFTIEAPIVPEQRPSIELTLELRWEDAKAECVVREGQFVIKAGSTARVKEVDSLGDYARERRRILRNEQVLVPEPSNDQLLRFAVDYAFDSPSAAAATVSGTGLNGRTSWKVKGQGISYKEWQEKQVRESQPLSESLSTVL
jgi:hypothetical protein